MDVDGGHDVEFSQGTQRFLDWFCALPGATFHKDISIVDLRDGNAGRGIVATADIPADTTLFTIPRQSILCTATSPLTTLLPSLFASPNPNADGSSNDGSEVTTQDPWTTLILILIYEHLRGPLSPWAPYLSILPTAFNTPMFWGPSDLAELQASALVAKIGQADADAMIRTNILSVIQARQDVFFPPTTSAYTGAAKPSDEQLLQLAHRVGSAIMAYAFDLEKDEDEEEDDSDEEDEGEDGWKEDTKTGFKGMMGMVPMADMLNADAEFNAHINHGEATLVATSLRPIKAGDEVLNYYGPLSSGELLRRYGYVTEKHTRYDVVELPWVLVQESINKRFKVSLNKEEDWAWVNKVFKEMVEEEGDAEVEDSFVLERASEEPDAEGRLTGEVVFTALPQELEAQVKAYLKAVKKWNGGKGLAAEALADKDTRKEIYLDSVVSALRDRESQYATTLEDDQELLATLDGRPSGRREMAVWVRRGEKKLLREGQAWVERKLAELKGKADDGRRGGGGGGDGPSAKRQRN
ncbi:hypothetical protein B0T17DRAFT_546640 [Bombardia bombarda]|uniref:SET domain-containing protein n=1 Tax=Bombardia bombarda TaxID=252184 RepID=A0AA39WA68_9PEZI|nr:hypothetical protein B0T17DRAFT_546640 [Bombardia bombarda]